MSLAMRRNFARPPPIIMARTLRIRNAPDDGSQDDADSEVLALEESLPKGKGFGALVGHDFIGSADGKENLRLSFGR
jgi:hypothetical protein